MIMIKSISKHVVATCSIVAALTAFASLASEVKEFPTENSVKEELSKIGCATGHSPTYKFARLQKGNSYTLVGGELLLEEIPVSCPAGYDKSNTEIFCVQIVCSTNVSIKQETQQ
jgi:hypothetical protein